MIGPRRLWPRWGPRGLRSRPSWWSAFTDHRSSLRTGAGFWRRTNSGALQALTTEGLGALAEAPYRCVFDRDEALVHVLIRDYARGVIELADRSGVLPLAVDIARARPPYRSAWPIEQLSKEAIEQYKEDYPGGHRFTDGIVSSAVNDGDFLGTLWITPSASLAACQLRGSDERRRTSTVMGRTTPNFVPAAYSRLEAVAVACEHWRANQDLAALWKSC